MASPMPLLMDVPEPVAGERYTHPVELWARRTNARKHREERHLMNQIEIYKRRAVLEGTINVFVR